MSFSQYIYLRSPPPFVNRDRDLVFWFCFAGYGGRRLRVVRLSRCLHRPARGCRADPRPADGDPTVRVVGVVTEIDEERDLLRALPAGSLSSSKSADLGAWCKPTDRNTCEP